MMDSVDEMYLSVTLIYKYLDGDINSRNIIEGERLLNSKHLILAGIQSKTCNFIDLLALCLQTSNLNGMPHEISCKLIHGDNKIIKIEKCICSCVAGISGKCKHSAAFLLYCNRNNVLSLELLSPTDIKCYWNKNKLSSKEEYKAVPIQEFCHVSKVDEYVVSQENLNRYKKGLLEICPNSSIKFHMDCININLNQENKNIITNVELHRSHIKDLLKLVFEKNHLQAIILPNMLDSLPEFLKNFYIEFIMLNQDESINLSKSTRDQDSELWHSTREKRITGSVCYEIYTYTKNKAPNWDKKFESFYNRKFFENTATKYGKDMEKHVQELFHQIEGYKIITTGIIILPQIPWLGYSPDGLIIIDDVLCLIEIKCPMLGTTLACKEMLPKLSYIVLDKGKYQLRKKHKYYGQIQLGMAITGASQCNLLVYSSIDDSYENIKILYDKTFVLNMIKNLNIIYFNYMLPFIFKKKYSLT